MEFETTPMLKNTGIVYGDDDDDGVLLLVPKPGRKLEPRPPPFLTKTYDMVDDPETNSYITWNSSGTGFVISDHNNFSAHVLPTFFKTTNFSSFVYQLNSYGFRKISWERYEYANQWFQAGKRHWLKNIKRRGQQSEWSQPRKKRTRYTPDQDSTNVTMESKLDAIITEQKDMKRDIQTLKQNLDSIEGQLTSLEIQKFPELKDEKMNIASFINQFTEHLKKKKTEASDDNSKRQRLDGSQNKEHPVEPMENTENVLSSADGSENSMQEPMVKKTADSKRQRLDGSQKKEHPVEPMENKENVLSSADGSESSMQDPKVEKTADSKRERPDGSENTEHPVEPMENTENVLSSADGSGSSMQDPKVEKAAEITEIGQFWMGILECDDAGFDSNEGHGYLDDLDSKAMIEEMMASNIAMQNEIIIAAKPSDSDEEEDRHLQLWT